MNLNGHYKAVGWVVIEDHHNGSKVEPTIVKMQPVSVKSITGVAMNHV